MIKVYEINHNDGTNKYFLISFSDEEDKPIEGAEISKEVFNLLIENDILHKTHKKDGGMSDIDNIIFN